MSSESELARKIRAKMSPEHAALDRWMYEITTDEVWRGSFLLGIMSENATRFPQIPYWNNLAHARQAAQQFILPPDKNPHRYWHILCHEYLDRLIADFIQHNPRPLGSIKSSIEDLMKWSYRQTISPTER